MTQWNDKVALITGGSAGLGRAIAAVFATHGAKVVICGRDQARLDLTGEQLRRQGGRVLTVVANIQQQHDVDALVARTIESFGQIDVLVNNVGRSSRGKLLDVSVEDFRDALDINFLTAVRMTRAVAPYVLATRGHIVNIGSLGAKSAVRFMGAYPSSKFPLAGYSQQLRLELAPEGVHVLFVCPGPIARDDSETRYAQQAADLPESAKRPGGGVNVKAIPPDELARRIIRCCERRKPELVVPGKARLLFALAQLWPSLADRIILRSTRAK